MPEFTTVTGALRYHAEKKGEKPCFVFRHPDLHTVNNKRVLQTFRQIHLLGGRYAAVLKRRGLQGRGDLVANTLPNCPERVVCEAGVLMTGAATVNAHCLLADGSDLLNTLRQSRACAVLLDPDVTYSPWLVLSKHVTFDLDPEGATVTSCSDLPYLKRVIFVRRTPEKDQDFLTSLLESEAFFEADDVSPDDVCSVFTTSGSSGFSKLVVHTHEGLFQAVAGNNPVYEGLTMEEVEFSMAPLGWLGGYAGNQFLAGTTRVLCDTREGLPKDVVDLMLTCCEEEKVNLMFVPAPRLEALLQRVRETKMRGQQNPQQPCGDSHATAQAETPKETTAKEENGAKEENAQELSSKDGAAGREVCLKKEAEQETPSGDLYIVDRITLGGQPIARSCVQMARLLAPKVFILYGSTETFLMTSMTVWDADSFVDYDSGVPVKGSSLCVVSQQDESVEMPAGQTGSILFKRSVMMKAYLHDPQVTAAAFTPDGLFRTGDVGKVDDRGHVIVEGRGSDAIFRGPFIFYPGWLEDRIKTCPGVSDAMVVGVPEHGDSEEICACVTLASGDVTVEQVREFVERDIVISDDEPLSPRPRHYLSFPSFPMTSTGKPIRKEVKQQARSRLSSSDD